MKRCTEADFQAVSATNSFYPQVSIKYSFFPLLDQISLEIQSHTPFTFAGFPARTFSLIKLHSYSLGSQNR